MHDAHSTCPQGRRTVCYYDQSVSQHNPSSPAQCHSFGRWHYPGDVPFVRETSDNSFLQHGQYICSSCSIFRTLKCTGIKCFESNLWGLSDVAVHSVVEGRSSSRAACAFSCSSRETSGAMLGSQNAGIAVLEDAEVDEDANDSDPLRIKARFSAETSPSSSSCLRLPVLVVCQDTGPSLRANAATRFLASRS